MSRDAEIKQSCLALLDKSDLAFGAVNDMRQKLLNLQHSLQQEMQERSKEFYRLRIQLLQARVLLLQYGDHRADCAMLDNIRPGADVECTCKWEERRVQAHEELMRGSSAEERQALNLDDGSSILSPSAKE